ncbi:MAG: ribosome silencing factor [Eubacteriales bacterium]|jgi:ribosome-associated protein
MTNTVDSKQLAEHIASLLDKKKAHDVKILRVTEKTVIADYFVIAGGTSSTQVKALADEVEYQIGVNDGIKPVNVEGRGTGGWVLLDYENVLVHVFDPKMREFYNLEKLWAECEEVPFDRIEE